MSSLKQKIGKVLGKRYVGRCEYFIESGNGIKPNVQEIKDEQGNVTRLRIQPICRCDETLGWYEFDDPTSIIIEKAVLQRKENEESGKRIPIEVGTGKTIVEYCSKCGREIVVTVGFNLAKPAVNAFFEQHERQTETMHYGNCLKIEVSVDGGFFREIKHPIHRTLQDLSSPKHVCGQTLFAKTVRADIGKMIDKVSEFFENSEIIDQIKPIETKDVLKCPFCLGKAIIRAKVTPTLPTTEMLVSSVVKTYESWKNRTHR